MERILVWDWPVRVFHWLFSAGWVAALVIALCISNSSPWFPYHSLIGLVLGLLVVLRILWGIAGTHHARFASFAFGPMSVMRYMKAALSWKDARHAGHNPGAAYAIFAMILLTIAQVATGLLVASGQKKLEWVHEKLAWVMIGVIVAHVLGLTLHTLRHRELIGLSMITGKKAGDRPDSIASGRPVMAIVFLAIVCFWAIGIYRNYNPVRQSTRVPLIGTEIQIGESEEEYE